MPIGTFVGQALGWRTVFWGIVVVGVLTLAGLVFFVPSTFPEEDQLPLGQQFRALTRPQVLVSLSTTALVFGGMFGVFAYIEPLLHEVSGFAPSAIPWLLVLFGLGLFCGNVLGGRAADRNSDRAVIILAILLCLDIAALGLAAHSRVLVSITLFVLGVVGFATVPGLQAHVMRHA